jgi:glycogen debranching enzyme
MQSAFDRTWWMAGSSLPLYADSLCDPGDVIAGGVCSQENQQLQQRHWINATPMETALAPQAHANAALDTLESSIFTGPGGLYHTGVKGGPDGQGELKCWTLPTSVMAVAEARYGRLGSHQALSYMDAIARLLDVEMPGALPEIAPSPQYDPFVDFRDRGMFMQAWSSYGIQWPIIHEFLGIDPDIPAGHLSVVPQIPDSWPGLSVRNLRIGGADTGISPYMAASATRNGSQFTTTVSAPAGWTLSIGHTLPAGTAVRSVTLDGARIPHRVVDTLRGREIRVETETGSPHTLAVTTQ